MIRFTPLSLEDCPVLLQEAVGKNRETAGKLDYPFSILSIMCRESTPYRDKTEVVQTYRVFLNYANIIKILECSKDGVQSGSVKENSLLWGDIMEILSYPPQGSSLEIIREAVLASDAARLLD